MPNYDRRPLGLLLKLEGMKRQRSDLGVRWRAALHSYRKRASTAKRSMECATARGATPALPTPRPLGRKKPAAEQKTYESAWSCPSAPDAVRHIQRGQKLRLDGRQAACKWSAAARGPQALKYDRNPPQGLACKGKKVRGHDSAWGYPSVPDNPRAKTSSLNG